MKIRDKISYQFTFLVGTILLFFCVMIYVVTFMQHQSEFYKELGDRAKNTAYIYLEEDGFSEEVYRAIQERYIQKLPEEIVQLYDNNNTPKFIEIPGENIHDDAIINHIRDNYLYPDYYKFQHGDKLAAGFFYPDNQGDFVVIISATDAIGQTFLENLIWILVVGFFLSLVIIFFTGRFFAIQALKPIPKIVNQVNSITASSLYIRLESGKEQDELSELTDTFNDLLKRLEENFNMQKRFVSNASHELRTPLTSMIGEIEVSLLKERTSEEYQETLNSIHHEALTMQELTTGLLELAQAESERLNMMFREVHVDEVITEAGRQIEKKYPDAQVNVHIDKPLGAQESRFVTTANTSLLFDVFLNVIDNAIKFSPHTQVADIFLTKENKEIRLTIKDYGLGIDEDEIDKIFDPFYRSQNVISQKGYGIGLSLVKRILNIFQGSIHIDSALHKGTTVTIFLIEK